MKVPTHVASDFREMVIGDVMAEFHDGPHATPPPADSGPVYLGIKNLTDSGRLDLTSVRHIADDDFDRWTKRVVPAPGDVVFTYEATLHRYALIPDGFNGCLGRRLALIRPHLDVVDPAYLHFMLIGPEWRQTVEDRVISGATVDRIPLLDFPEFPIRLPSLPTQRRIAALLSAFNELIEINERRIELLEDLARSLYREWFVHFRFPGHEDVAFVDSKQGPIPEGWEATRLDAVARILMGQSPKSEFYNGVGHGLPFHQGVTGYGALIPNHEKFCTIAPRKAEASDVLCSVRAPVGRLNLADQEIVIGRGLAAIRRKDQAQAFLLPQLRQAIGDEDSIGGGTIYKAITKGQLTGLAVLEPDGYWVDQYQSIADPMLDERITLTHLNRELVATRDLLLPRLVTGRLDLSEIDLGVLTPADVE